MSLRVAFVLPDERPSGLRARALEVVGYCLDAVHPSEWGWTPFAAPWHRFDPVSNKFRVRYAASGPRGAVRERFPERRLGGADGAVWLVRLEGRIRVLDLCSEATLDRLGVDDRISTARLPRVRSEQHPDPFLDACGRLSDLTRAWWDGQVPAIRFRSRASPETTRNLVFCHAARWVSVTAMPLAQCTDLLVALAEGDGFAFPSTWLARG